MKLYSFLNSKGEVLTVVGPTDTVPPIESCQGAESVVEGDLTTKGAKRAVIQQEVPTSPSLETEIADLKVEITQLKEQLTTTVLKVGVLETKETAIK